jgi:hypothetical protein
MQTAAPHASHCDVPIVFHSLPLWSSISMKSHEDASNLHDLRRQPFNRLCSEAEVKGRKPQQVGETGHCLVVAT